ncbi:hypothetical protein FE633_33425 [Streptomyces montanus]|uniref:TPM domain-containing protein n=1 Tax=Streptomyces montanus TaxID=2580423 RepID=A0A5R9FKA8_9ACTN|nr:hypothetical protein [Streptomyces montanus]TLS41978.1 hypothetical protein FE633_33425 [Streptomyces montanus]
MSAKRVHAGLSALLAACVTVLLISAAPASWAKDPSPGERIATALRESPVYVDPSYEGSVPPARQKELAHQIARTGLPVKVALTPLTKGDSFNGDSSTLAEIVHDRLGVRDLILITTDGDFTDSLNGYEWPGEAHQADDAVATVGFLDEMDDAGLADRTAKAIELIEDGDGTNAYEEATKDLGGEGSEGGDSASTPKSPRGEATSSWLWPTLVAVPALAAGFVTFLFVRRRGARLARLTYPRAVFTAARTADEADVRRRAEAEVLSLGESIQSAPPSTPGLQSALDAYAAAGTVLDAARGLPDLAGVLALAAEGRDALEATPTPLPLCFFNPLHGRATDRIAWRALGRRESLRVAACTSCAEAVRTRRAPEVLMDTTEDGRPLPYFELSDGLWARTGYGSLLKDPDGGLAQLVGRGDFSRTFPASTTPERD